MSILFFDDLKRYGIGTAWHNLKFVLGAGLINAKRIQVTYYSNPGRRKNPRHR